MTSPVAIRVRSLCLLYPARDGDLAAKIDARVKPRDAVAVG
jgi:hypothetical protein